MGLIFCGDSISHFTFFQRNFSLKEKTTLFILKNIIFNNRNNFYSILRFYISHNFCGDVFFAKISIKVSFGK